MKIHIVAKQHFHIISITIAVDCVWSEWQNGTCSQTCGAGMMVRTRTKMIEASHGGKDCEDESTDNVTCSIIQCPG